MNIRASVLLVQNASHNVIHEWYALAKNKLENKATNHEKDNYLKAQSYLIYLLSITRHKFNWTRDHLNTAHRKYQTLAHGYV